MQYDGVFCFKYSPRPNTPAIACRTRFRRRRSLARLAVLNERQREIQRANYSRHIGEVIEVMVEGYSRPRPDHGPDLAEQDAEFHRAGGQRPAVGGYVKVRVTQVVPEQPC